jgi:hypothetical protein
MTREEALKVANEMHQWVKTDREKEALETLIPELKESEDERIIKTLQEYVKTRNWNLGGPTQAEVLAWLEKQKYDRMKPIYDARESFESALEKAWNDYHNGYENVDKLEDDYVECAHAKGFREGYLFGIEKQKPIISIDQLKSLMLQYLQEAANEKDDSDIEADTDKWARKILGYDLEQKPVWSEEDEAHVEFILESLEDQIRFCKKDAEGAYYAKQIRMAQNWLKALHERFGLQPKQERNEEDEKVRKWLLEYFYLHRDDLRGASVTSMEILSFLENHPGKGEEDIDESEFNPKPGEEFWVRCKTNKTVNLWFDKDDERPAYAVTDANGIITYIVHIKKDGKGNCVSYQNKEKFLETFEIIEK